MQHESIDAHLEPVDAERVRAITRPDDKLFKLYLIYTLLSNVAAPFAFLPLYFHFKTLRYRFDEQGVAVSYGLLWRKETYLTYARIQDIHVTRNIFERWLGLGTVEIQTAAGTSGAAESITGVKEYNEIRNYLYAHMRGHKSTDHKVIEPTSSIDEALIGIRDELRAVRTLMEGSSDV